MTLNQCHFGIEDKTKKKKELKKNRIKCLFETEFLLVMCDLNRNVIFGRIKINKNCWCTSSWDMVDKKKVYLKVYNVIWLFLFRNNQKISSANNASEIKKATIRLLRTIVVLTQTMNAIPEDTMLTMKLLYYDDGDFYFW